MSGIYQYLQNDTLIQYDGEKVTATYIPSSDPLLKQPLSTYPASHEQKLKAIIQQYMTRMTGNKLVMSNE